MSDVIYSPSVSNAVGPGVSSSGPGVTNSASSVSRAPASEMSYTGDNYGISASMTNMLSEALQQQRKNNVIYANNANSANATQRWFQKDQQAFNSHEAASNRAFQEKMSNTAHQREVKDLILAGLNPVLSALNGQGATTPAGSAATSSQGSSKMAGVDSNTAMIYTALISLMGTMINSTTAYDAAVYRADRSLEGVMYQSDNSAYAATHSSIFANTGRAVSDKLMEFLAALGDSKVKPNFSGIYHNPKGSWQN